MFCSHNEKSQGGYDKSAHIDIVSQADRVLFVCSPAKAGSCLRSIQREMVCEPWKGSR